MAAEALPHLRRNDPTDDIVEALDRTGAVVIDDLIDPAAVTAITSEVSPDLETADPEMTHINEVLQTFYSGVRNVTGLASRSSTFVESVLLNPALLDTAEAILGPNCASLSLNVAHLMVREPGAPQQWLHRDQNVWSFVPDPHPELELSSVIALSDFTKANGGTAVVPGSHRWEPGRQPEPHEITYAEMPAGAAVVYLGSTIHAGGTNETSQPRTGIHLSYVVGWLRTEENNCLATPPDLARMLPRRAQQLVGYDMHDAAAMGGGYLGLVDLRDPVELLTAGAL